MRGGGTIGTVYLFGGIVVGKFREKWDDNQKKIFFTNTISKIRDFLSNRKITCEETSWNLLKSCLPFRGSLEGSNEEQMVGWRGGGGNRKKRFYGKMWANAV